MFAEPIPIGSVDGLITSLVVRSDHELIVGTEDGDLHHYIFTSEQGEEQQLKLAGHHRRRRVCCYARSPHAADGARCPRHSFRLLGRHDQRATPVPPRCLP